jgi:hypothetical protein
MLAAHDAGVAELPAGPVEPSSDAGDTPAASRVRLRRSLRARAASLQSAGELAPPRLSDALLVAVDDAHRVDEASSALLAALAHGAPERRLVVLVTADSPRRRFAGRVPSAYAPLCSLELEP